MNSKKSLVSLHYYPIKGCKVIDCRRMKVNPMGPEMDRRWMIVDEKGRFISQRQEPKMALIGTAIDQKGLTLRIPGEGEHRIAIFNEGPRKEVAIWDDVCLGIDQGDEIAERLSRFLGRECRLVFMPDSTHRPINPKYAGPEAQVGFADRFSFLLISEASLEDLNSRLDRPVPMNRFRPNLVVSGCRPFEEDGWKRIRIGQIHFSIAKPCSRCTVTTVDQSTAEKGDEPLKTLATYRKQEKGIMFGQNLVHLDQGFLSVGDSVEIIE